MATKDELRDIEDAAAQINAQASKWATTVSAVDAQLRKINKNTADLGALAEGLVRTNDDWKKSYLSGNDVLKDITKNTETLNKFQKDSLDLGKQLIDKYHTKALDKLNEELGFDLDTHTEPEPKPKNGFSKLKNGRRKTKKDNAVCDTAVCWNVHTTTLLIDRGSLDEDNLKTGTED